MQLEACLPLMANSKSTIVNSWSLISFAKAFGPRMQVGTFTNGKNGEEFKSTIFTSPGGARTFVAFSANLGELSPKEIAAMKHELQVVELETEGYEEHHFSLCKQGQGNWEDVDLGL